MPKVQKRSGREEEFDREKLKRSIRSAGASEDASREIAERISVSEGVNTKQIRGVVTEQLENRDSESCSRYQNTRRYLAKVGDPGLEKESVRLHADMMEELKARPGDTLEVMASDKAERVRVAESSLDKRELHLNNETLNALEVPEGTRVSARKVAV
jgi:arginine/ornithine N-succinyltransferase beta subunit